MRRKIFALLVGCFITLGTAAQRDSDSPLRFGLQFNPLLTWNKTENNFSPDGIKGGFEYGLNVHYYFYKNVGIESGLYMNHHGARFRYLRDQLINNPEDPDTTKYRYDYNLNNIFIKIPLALRFRTNQIGPVYLFGKFGVEAGFAISSKLKFSGQDGLFPSDGVPEINTFDEKTYRISSPLARIGLMVGGGVEYPISGSFSLTAGLEYNYGFLNILRDDLSSSSKPFLPSSTVSTVTYKTPDKEDVRTQYLALTIGALF
jgi:hypothetical protein